MSKSERLDAVMRRQVIQNLSKANGKLTNNQTLKPYNRQIAKFCEWSKELGIKRMHDIEKMGYTPTTLIQKYAEYLQGKALKATSIHTYLAPVWKGLGLGMEQINKPPRLSRESRIYIREGNKERALELGRPTDYDWVAVRIASVYALSHWEDESTIRNYLVK